MKENIHNYNTNTEIFGQPSLWISVYQLLLDEKKQMASFLQPILKRENLQIILTGAGSSAFIGEAAQGVIQKNTGICTKAIATTDFVTHPELLFLPDVPTLLISFARSGNSPESLETVKLADLFCKEVYHLIISCNKEGELAQHTAKYSDRAYILILPEESNDKSLAMTGSFTSMLLSVLLISDLPNILERRSEISDIINQGKLLLENSKDFCAIAAKNFKRVVFLGSGPMLGIARECHLKLQELTDGQVICKHDSFLGFRHGPRAVTNDETLLVYLFSPSDYVYKYELDLALSMAKESRKFNCLSIGRPEKKELNSCLNIDLKLKEGQEFNIVPAALVGQMLGFYKSLKLNLNPDSPSVTGGINRVVQGVNIYEHSVKSIEWSGGFISIYYFIMRQGFTSEINFIWKIREFLNTVWSFNTVFFQIFEWHRRDNLYDLVLGKIKNPVNIEPYRVLLPNDFEKGITLFYIEALKR